MLKFIHKKTLALLPLFILFTSPIKAEDFGVLLKKVEKHPNVELVRQQFVERAFIAKKNSSLMDPTIKFSAINVPTSSLSFDKTPMSSKQVALAQKIPLTTKLSHLTDQSKYLIEAGNRQSKYQTVVNRAYLWIVSAKVESLNSQLKIVKNSFEWVTQVNRVTEELYSVGKTNQITLLEIKVRKAELETKVQDLNFKISQASNQIGFLIGVGQSAIIDNVPWEKLAIRESNLIKGIGLEDNKQLSLLKELRAAGSKLRAAELSYVPDLMIGAAYSFRENVDGQGDFVSGFIQLSVPLWGGKKSEKNAAKAKQIKRELELKNYKLNKINQSNSLFEKILSLKKEIKLTLEIIKYAELEKELATKRYSLGKMSVFELLEVELKLRKKKLQKEILEERLRSSQIKVLLLKGDDLSV